MIIFGGSGDLARRKILPSIYRLAKQYLLPDEFTMITVASTKRTDDEYRNLMYEAIKEYTNEAVDDDVWNKIQARIHYIGSKFDTSDGYVELSRLLDNLSKKSSNIGNLIFYLATQPSYFPQIINQLGDAGLGHTSRFSTHKPRIVIEKPYGNDKESASELSSILQREFTEEDIYRIDHYLGKETVRNLLVFRFSNLIFESIWSHEYIDHVQITSAENIGIEDRGRYYEEAGITRDMLQNHILQLLSLIAMEPPSSLSATAISDEKLKVLKAIRPFASANINHNVICGQYDQGIINGVHVPAYRDENNVSPASVTDTFVAAKFMIDNDRWKDTPFYIRAGKRLTRKRTEIAIQFKPVSNSILAGYSPTPNVLVIRIQPDEGISLKIETKLPGIDINLRSVDMDFHYLNAMGVLPSEAYEKLLLDCMRGDQTLFTGRPILEQQWEIIDPILKEWKSNPHPDFPNYRSGSMGPVEAMHLIERDGRRWRRI
ncbi:MAG: glucose-6-phosphate dehydrogenase [Armatimonadota bacterium]